MVWLDSYPLFSVGTRDGDCDPDTRRLNIKYSLCPNKRCTLANLDLNDFRFD